ncbi:MAG: DNA/RNA non-specific endonuclease [Bacteroidota bacterium]
MKRISILCLLILCACFAGYAQLLVNKEIYKVNFSNTLHEPRYVSYFLYKGGGSCNRDKFVFLNDEEKLLCATDTDYKGSIYDKGHLANAEDFAFDCAKDELTFRYYNCLPQTVNLNRGKWKTNESLVRKWSQTQRLYIICGGYFGGAKTGNAAVPDYCWKVVQSVSTKEVLFCGWFSNTSHATLEEISVAELEKRLRTKIVLLK